MSTCLPAPNFRGRLRDQRGQAVVEFAIVLPVLMLVILGILYFGRYESYSTQMTQLAEQGARDAAVDYQVPSGTTVTVNGTTHNCVTGAGAPTSGGPYPASGSNIPNNIACFIASQATGELAQGSSDAQQLQVDVDCQSTSGSTSICTAGQNVTVCTRATVQFPFLSIKAGTIYQSATMRVESAGTNGATSPYPIYDSYETSSSSAGMC
jgi:Flp pilus assembly protein TadG